MGKLIDAEKLIEKLSTGLDNPEEFPVISLGTILRMIDNEPEVVAQPNVPDTNVGDIISRQAVIDAIFSEPLYKSGMKKRDVDVVVPAIYEKIKSLPSVQPEKQHGRIFQEIIVEYPSYNTYPEYKGKPYFSIKYTENGQGFIGYGTYKPEVLSEYLKEYFMPSAQPERTGRWILDENDFLTKCSECGCHPWFGVIPTAKEATKKLPHCPMCLAKMECER